MQETEKIKADNQISKNENLVQVCFFNQSRFKTNRKAVNLSHGGGFPPQPGRPLLSRAPHRAAAGSVLPPSHSLAQGWHRARGRQVPGCAVVPLPRLPATAPWCGLRLPWSSGTSSAAAPALGALLEAVWSFGLVPCSGGAKQGARWPRADGGTSTAGCAGRAHPALLAEPAARGTVPAALVSSRQRVRLTRGRAGPATH